MLSTRTAVRLTSTASRQTRLASSAIAHKYAQAAYGAALKKSPAVLDTVNRELAAIGSAIKSDAALAAFVSNPLLSGPDRRAGLSALYAAATKDKKGEVNEVTKNLFGVLAENRRLVETEEVVRGFTELVGKYKGELEVVVTSAVALDKDVLGRLERALKGSQTAQKAKSVRIVNKVSFLFLILVNKFCLGKKVLLNVGFLQVRESLIGGLVVDFGDKSVDLSVASRVNKINTLLQGELV